MLKQREQTTKPKLENHKELPLHTFKLPLNQCNSPWTNACKPLRKIEQLPQLCSDWSDQCPTSEHDADISTDQDVTQVDEHNTPININQGPITRSRAKKLQREVNSLLAEINFNMSKNVILSKVLHWLYLGIYVRGVVQLFIERKQRRRNKWISSDQG
jgi:hypothetical protein